MNTRQGAPLVGGRAGGQKAPLNLIHINNSPNPILARVSGRFDYPEGVPVDAFLRALRLPFPLAVELLRRAKK